MYPYDGVQLPESVDMRSVFWCSLLVLLGLCASAQARPPRFIPPLPALRALPPSLIVGQLRLVPCRDVPAYCGQVLRPLDPSGQVPGTIAVAFEYYPPQDAALPPLGTIAAAEGGPGYSTTGSRNSYLDLFLPLLNQRALLLVDNRGTGKSEPIDCKLLQRTASFTQASIRQCGAQLGQRSDLYGSGLAADDLAAVLDVLDLKTVDLYGDSYGTFFSQAFAGRHPNRLRSLSLDAAYPVIGASPWYPENGEAVRDGFDAVCRRSVTCQDLPGTTLERIGQLLDLLRVAPVTGTAPNGNGTPQTVTADAGALAFVMFAGGYGPVTYRELDAAARAYLDKRDSAPLLRLVSENQTFTRSFGLPRFYSAGLFTAVSCTDNPQIYDMTSPPALRRPQGKVATAQQQATAPDIYAPFTIAEYRSQPLEYSYLDLCLNWPVPSLAYPPGQPVTPGAEFTPAPVLVLSGDLDTITAPASGNQAAALFSNSTWLPVFNSFHVTALGDQDDCASRIVRLFVETLNPGDTSCTAAIAEVRTVPTFARSYRGVPAATPSDGNQGSERNLQVAATAALSAGDVLSRWWVNYDRSGVGLRAGTFTYAGSGSEYRFTLDGLRWTDDLAVSGTVDWNYSGGQVVARLTLSGATTGMLEIGWNDRQPEARATIAGQIDGRSIQATMPAP